MKPDALIVIDVQQALTKWHPDHEKELLTDIRRLLEACRHQGIPVLFIQHEEDEGEMKHGGDGWQIDEAVAPRAGEKIFGKKYSSAFRQTGLHEYLKSIGVQNLILCGMQTEYCVDATVKVAFELGYDVLIPDGGTSTFQNGPFTAADLVRFYQWRIWHQRFATVVPMDTLLAEIGE